MFEEKGVILDQVVEARKEKIDGDTAWKLLSGAKKLVVGRGKKSVVFDPATDDREEILKVCTGRTGNLRAPTLKIGDLILVGYNDEMYATYLGQG